MTDGSVSWTSQAWRIARKDMREAWQSGLAPVLNLLFVGMFAFAMADSTREYFRLRADQQTAQTEARSQWLGQGEKNPHGAGHFGTLTFKPVHPLWMFEKGVDAYLGRILHLETHRQNDPEGKPARDASELRRFGELTPGFLLRFLAPLGILLLGCGSVAAERRQGTLRLLQAQGLGVRAFLAGKFIGLWLNASGLWVPMAVGLLVSIAISGSHPDAVLGLVLCTASLLYLLTFAFLTLGISSLCGEPRPALATGLCIWIFFSVLAPPVAVEAAELMHPTPSSIAFKEGLDEASGNHGTLGYGGFDMFNDVYRKVEAKLMREYGVAHADSLPVNPFGYAIEETEEEGQRLYDHAHGELRRQFSRQNIVYGLASVLSPSLSLRTVSMEAARTGFAEHLHFIRQSEEYRRVMMRALNMDIAENSRNPGFNLKTRVHVEYKRGRGSGPEDAWTMILALARFECRRIFRSPRAFLPIAALLMGILAGFSGARWTGFQEEAIRTLERLRTTQGERINTDAAAMAIPDTVQMGTPLHPLSVYWKRQYAFLPPSPLAPLAVGRSDIEPYYAVFNGMQPNVLLFPEEIRNPMGLLYGRWDARFLIVLLLPLLIIVMGFDLASEDRESGNGRLLAAGMGSLSRYFLVRVAVQFFLIAGAGLAGLFLALTVAGRLPGLLVPALPAYLACALAYLVFWSVLCLWVNGWGRPSGYNLAALFLIWAGMCFLFPTALESLARRMHPEPSRGLQALDIRQARMESGPIRKQLADSLRRREPILLAPLVSDARPALIKAIFPELLAEQEHMTRVADSLEYAFTAARRDQAALVRRFQWLLPPLAVQQALLALSGRDAAAHKKFDASVARFRDKARRAVWPRFFQSRAFTPSELEGLPKWADERISDASRMDSPWKGIGATLLALVLPGLLLGVRGWRSLRNPVA